MKCSDYETVGPKFVFFLFKNDLLVVAVMARSSPLKIVPPHENKALKVTMQLHTVKSHFIGSIEMLNGHA